MATKSRSKFSPLKKRSDESEAGEGDHEIMSISCTSTSNSGTFKEGIMNHNNVFNHTYSILSMVDT